MITKPKKIIENVELLRRMYEQVLPKQKEIRDKAHRESMRLELKVLRPLVQQIVESVPEKLKPWFDSYFDYKTYPEKWLSNNESHCLFKIIKDNLWVGPFGGITVRRIELDDIQNKGISSFPEFVSLLDEFNDKNKVLVLYRPLWNDDDLKTTNAISLDWNINKPDWVKKRTKENSERILSSIQKA